MASLSIHLAIGNRYLDKFNDIVDKKAFMKGVIAPDMVQNKSASHYSKNQSRENAFIFYSNKVYLVDYLKAEYDNSDYQKGVFLHLVTDYLFFCKFLDKKLLQSFSLEDFFSNIYFSYDKINNYIDNKYKIDYTDFFEVKEKLINAKKKQIYLDKNPINLLDIEKTDEFIEYVSNINLEKYKEKLLKHNDNIFP